MRNRPKRIETKAARRGMRPKPALRSPIVEHWCRRCPATKVTLVDDGRIPQASWVVDPELSTEMFDGVPLAAKLCRQGYLS